MPPSQPVSITQNFGVGAGNNAASNKKKVFSSPEPHQGLAVAALSVLTSKNPFDVHPPVSMNVTHVPPVDIHAGLSSKLLTTSSKVSSSSLMSNVEGRLSVVSDSSRNISRGTSAMVIMVEKAVDATQPVDSDGLAKKSNQQTAVGVKSSVSSDNKQAQKPHQMTPFLRFVVLRKILQLNDGRDKVLKIVQYSAKTVLWLRILLTAMRGASAAPSSSGAKEAVERTEKMIGHFSLARKIVRLCNFMEPMEAVIKFAYGVQALTALEVMANVNATLNGLSDDAVCFAKMGLIDSWYSKVCTPLSNYLWMAGIGFDMKDTIRDWVKAHYKMIHDQRKLTKAEDTTDKTALAADVEASRVKKRNAELSIGKLLADFVFCIYDCAELGNKGWNEGWQNVSGLISALLGTLKLFRKLK